MKKYNHKSTRSKNILLFGIILLFPFLISCFSGQNNSNLDVLPLDITVEQAFQERENGALILDVRTESEWEEVHIPGSTRILLDDLPNRLNEVPEDTRIVVVCRSGNRSQIGRDTLLNAGFEEVTSMIGGVSQWRDLGYPVESGP